MVEFETSILITYCVQELRLKVFFEKHGFCVLKCFGDESTFQRIFPSPQCQGNTNNLQLHPVIASIFNEYLRSKSHRS